MFVPGAIYAAVMSKLAQDVHARPGKTVDSRITERRSYSHETRSYCGRCFQTLLIFAVMYDSLSGAKWLFEGILILRDLQADSL